MGGNYHLNAILSAGRIFSQEDCFRSPDVQHYSENSVLVNVQGRLAAASLATQALRQGKSPLRGSFALFRLPFGSGPSLRPGRPSPPPASLRADPVSRQRLIDFQPEQGHCCNALIFSRTGFAVKKNRGNGQVWAGPAENCRRVSVRPEEPAWMRVQGAFCRDATSRPPGSLEE